MAGLVRRNFSRELKLAIAEARLAGIHERWIRLYMYFLPKPPLNHTEMAAGVRMLMGFHAGYAPGESPYADRPYV